MNVPASHRLWWLAAGALPPHHADPFDRMLIAQAGLAGLTRDRRLAA